MLRRRRRRHLAVGLRRGQTSRRRVHRRRRHRPFPFGRGGQAPSRASPRAFELVWCTGWEEKANEYLVPALGLPGPLPYLSFDRHVRAGTTMPGPLEARRDRRVRAATAPLAWIDDAFNDACHAWARARRRRCSSRPTREGADRRARDLHGGRSASERLRASPSQHRASRSHPALPLGAHLRHALRARPRLARRRRRSSARRAVPPRGQTCRGRARAERRAPVTRSRPARLEAYSASSATPHERRRRRGRRPGSEATPMQTVTRGLDRRVARRRRAGARRPRRPRSGAVFGQDDRELLAAVARRACRSRGEHSSSTAGDARAAPSSPAWWPCVSLSRLKWSRSSSARPTDPPPVRPRARQLLRRARVWNVSRLARPVSAVGRGEVLDLLEQPGVAQRQGAVGGEALEHADDAALDPRRRRASGARRTSAPIAWPLGRQRARRRGCAASGSERVERGVGARVEVATTSRVLAASPSRSATTELVVDR